ncbi:MAG: lipoprotein-releasing ABC transporter permease subunit [Alphaproteobacteria bacterium]|nr:lipoprotein-releasing ABC transporter permease subunit [Alphaproteobacteria bacterium]
MLKTELLIAWRYIKSKRKEKVISAIAAFSLVGIALGVATLIVVTSVMNGFRKEFTERVVGFNGHIAMHPTTYVVEYNNIARDITKMKEVVSAVPMIEQQALLSNQKTVRGSLVCGISAADLSQKKLIANNIITGQLEHFNQEDAIVLGDALAKRARINLGDEVIVIVPKMDETGIGVVPRKKTFRLVATFASGMHEYDSSVSYIPLDTAQKLFKMKDYVTSISVFAKNPMEINALKNTLNHKYANKFVLTDWQSSNSSFMKAVEIERNVMFLILTLITLVASFNIISCMIMLVKDKEKDIAILRTIGLTRNSITKIFFTVGASIGVSGTLIGTLLGLLFSMNIQKIQHALDAAFNTKVFSPEVYFLTNLPSLVRPIDVLVTVIVSLLLSCLATLYPARKASKLNPTEILRYA